MKLSLLLASILLITPPQSSAAAPPETLSIIPKPMSMQRGDGAFTLNQKTSIIVRNGSSSFIMAGRDLQEKLRRATGYPIDIRPDHRSVAVDNTILLTNEVRGNSLGDEGYQLSVGKNSIRIAAQTAHGAFYAIQSLLQLLPAEVEGRVSSPGTSWSIPCVEIVDKPRFPWRGMHLDVGRHFFPAAFIKKYIDLMAAYKLNTFHWHLTEDQGWRIEIRKYPLLTEVGSHRRETMGDSTPYGGFYTQNEVREIVEYARQRFITIVPEIEMPGHSLAALAAYPALSCSGGPLQVATEWGVFDDVYCAGREETFEFLRNVLEEVTELFPGPFVHIGGDECPKIRWKHCARCQDRIRNEGLKDESELQSYFIRRIGKILNLKGKRLLGWDEILEGGLAPNATVMSWRGTQGGIEAAKSGHDVVMSPGSNCYFDYYQGKFGEPAAIGGYLPIDSVYSYEPVPAGLSAEESKHILGAQGNMWTEWMPDSLQVEYMLLPRMLALSEVVWTQRTDRNEREFTLRLEKHYDRLAAMDVNFRVPPPIGGGGRAVIFRDTLVTLSSPVSGGTVYYSLGEKDSIPSQLFSHPITVKGDEVLRAQTTLKNGRKSNIVTTEFMRVDPGINGLNYDTYEGAWDSLPDFSSLKPTRSGRVYDIALGEISHREDNFALRLSGFITIDTDGDYRFTISSDDGSKLSIDDKETIDNDGLHGAKEASATLRLNKGRHPIAILYFERTGNQSLDLSMEGPHISKRHVPPRILSH